MASVKRRGNNTKRRRRRRQGKQPGIASKKSAFASFFQTVVGQRPSKTELVEATKQIRLFTKGLGAQKTSAKTIKKK